MTLANDNYHVGLGKQANAYTENTAAHVHVHVHDGGQGQVHLTPMDRAIFDQGWQINCDYANPRPFSFKDYPAIDYGTFRNSVSRLKGLGLVYLVIRSCEAFYACKGSGIKAGSMTLGHMVGGRRTAGLEELLLELGDAVAGVHDIRLVFDCPSFYSCLDLIPDRKSKDKRLSAMVFAKGRTARVVAHTNCSVSVIVGCSSHPFACDNLAELFFLLETVRDEVVFKYFQGSVRVPPVGDWVVTVWHYGKDGGEIAGERFEVTLSDFSDVIYRFYSKSTSRGRMRPRLERIESPRVTFKDLATKSLRSDQ